MARAERCTGRFRIYALLTTDSNVTSTDDPYVVAKADQALYAAKHSGRDRVLSSECALLTFANKEAVARRVKRKVRAR
jgi:hypothetical protein